MDEATVWDMTLIASFAAVLGLCSARAKDPDHRLLFGLAMANYGISMAVMFGEAEFRSIAGLTFAAYGLIATALGFCLGLGAGMLFPKRY